MTKKPMTSSRTSATRSGTVTTTDVREALARSTPTLAAEEEKALRMLHGVPVSRTTVLERVGQDHPASREKLLGIELELLRQWRERQAAKPEPRNEAKAAPASPRREKIVAALKTKAKKVTR